MNRLGNISRQVILALLCVVIMGFISTVEAGEVSVRAVVVERGEIFVGESFHFEIRIDGSDTPAEPDLSGLTGFAVQSLGGGANNSQSITIINGQMTEHVKRGYVFSYALTPQRAGELTIPSLQVVVDGKRLATRPTTIRVSKPTETEDFKLRMSLSKTSCYVGEPVVLTVTFYFGKNINNVQFVLPILSDPRFSFEDPDENVNNGSQWHRVPVSGLEALAEQGSGRLEGRSFSTLVFRKVLVPNANGEIDIPQATAACQVLVGYERSRSLFSIGREGQYKRFVAPSNELTLSVRELPIAGKPPNFSGHTGEYRLTASATPTDVNVGDPITLTIRLSGPPYLKNETLPPLRQQASLARDFKIPEEQAPGKVEGSSKIFTQTVRATNDKVKEIPPIELSYFDSKHGEYRVARTEPIPLTVHSTRIITADHAEGREPIAPAKRKLRAWTEGIAHNYEDHLSVLENQDYSLMTLVRTPHWLLATSIPFLAFVCLFVGTMVVRRSQADPARRKAKRAYAELVRELKSLNKAGEGRLHHGFVLDAFRRYLGSKMGVSAGSLTGSDVAGALRDRAVEAETIGAIDSFFESCEAVHYSGGAGEEDPESLGVRALDLAKKLERELR